MKNLTKKEILNEFLQSYFIMEKVGGTTHKIDLFNGIKPASYCVPRILDYLDNPPYSKETEKQLKLEWFVEIWIDDVCIWRKSAGNEFSENLEQFEEPLIDQIILEITAYGLNAALRDTLERINRNNTFTKTEKNENN